ncbi:predicted protein [Naegleria gruberi]|uniref:Predicted protein n=1 Tax=Naegleria gruberi TaxID=5762 RepID=D2V5F6_NAEGR|nr:uncharacterized protein NAEGRDRAFT_63805 [Naegleria gruberi]EFC47940.1 predicted protein [Naegleria gruberi]|eukprot:XP_002680684.1 predicted protein [Naegleria gruberi strain NEG-M]
MIMVIQSNGLVEAQNFCKTYTDCSGCVQSPDNGCVWCSSSRLCVPVTSTFSPSIGYTIEAECPIQSEPISLFTEMCTDPLFEICGNRELPNIVESNSSLFDASSSTFESTKSNQSVKDVSLCQEHTDCVSDKNCVYVSRGFFTITDPESLESRVIPLGANGTCWRALPVLGSPVSYNVHRGGLIYSLTTQETYYATCVIREVYYWVIIGCSLLAISCCICTGCVCCLCCFCFYCKRDRRYISLNG